MDISVNQTTKTYIHHLYVDTGYCLKDLPMEMDGKKERESKESVLLACLDDEMMI